jgi:hypothetical protein
MQRTAIGFVSVENRGFSIKWCGGVYFMWIFVYSFFKISCDIYVLVCVCVSLDLFWYCVVMVCGFFADSLLCYIYVLTVLCIYSIRAGTGFGTALHLSTVITDL